MKSFFKIAIFLALLAFIKVESAFSQADEEVSQQHWVEYQDGEISLVFDYIPVQIALNEIRVRTGVEIVLPPARESKLLNLRLSRLPLEPAVRSLISTIGFGSFALMYDENGRPTRAIVLGARLDDRAALAADSESSSHAEPALRALTVEERDRLQKELERWSELKQEDRGRIEDRLKTLPASEEREQLVKEYGRQLLGIRK